MDDPYPYFRGMIAEVGLPHKELPYDQPRRKTGITKNNFYTHYDQAMLGLTSLSKVPLRMATFVGPGSVPRVSLLAGLFLPGIQAPVLAQLYASAWPRL